LTTVLSILHHAGRRLEHFNLGAHFLDLGGLLSELGCESLYLFLLLRDRCFQLLNFANSAIERPGWLLRLGAAARLRCATMRHSRCATTPGSGRVIAKLVGIKVQSNYNNVAANGLEVVPDTTDEAGCGPEPISRDVGDADRKVFVVDGFPIVVTNELAQVSVIAASGQVWSCPCTHDCVRTTSNAIKHRQSANCRVETGAVVSRVIILKREITNGGILSARHISKERGIANGVVTESGGVILERRGAKSAVE
jgi:hypothetical protein